LPLEPIAFEVQQKEKCFGNSCKEFGNVHGINSPSHSS
jgi:hypothetical protein